MEEPDHRARELTPGVDAVGALDVERADAVAFGLLGDPRELAAARLTDVPDPHALPPKRTVGLAAGRGGSGEGHGGDEERGQQSERRGAYTRDATTRQHRRPRPPACRPPLGR